MPFIVTDYIDKEFCKEVATWATQWHDKIGSKRFYSTGSPEITASIPIKSYGKMQRWVDLSKHDCPLIPFIKSKIFTDFKVPIQDAMLNYYVPQTNVGRHAHVLEAGKVDLRFNILVQQPESGGNPIIDGRKYCIQQGDLLVFDSRKPHETDTVCGETDRILLSCIGVIAEKDLADRMFLG